MADWTYLGVTTHSEYRFISRQDIQVNGQFTQKITINGETAVLTNRDGSITRGTAAGNTQDIYSPSIAPSVWEQQ